MDRIKPHYDGIRLNCTVVSDTHIDIKHPAPEFPPNCLKQVLEESQNNLSPVDAFIITGDTTSRGSKVNWDMTLECFEKYKPAKQIIPAIGNHDCWHDDGYEAAMKNYYVYFEKICGKTRQTSYFSYIINGYYLIFLGNEGEAGCEAVISDGQIRWLKQEMDCAAREGKPVFVFCHQSLNRKHGLPKTWDADESATDPMEGGIGERSGEIEEILKACKNVYYFSGHSHMGLGGENCLEQNGYASFEKEGNLNLINLPSLACGNHHGEVTDLNIGVQLEVYDDKVIVCPRNFAKHQWNETVLIRNGKYYLEEPI